MAVTSRADNKSSDESVAYTNHRYNPLTTDAITHWIWARNNLCAFPSLIKPHLSYNEANAHSDPFICHPARFHTLPFFLAFFRLYITSRINSNLKSPLLSCLATFFFFFLSRPDRSETSTSQSRQIEMFSFPFFFYFLLIDPILAKGYKAACTFVLEKKTNEQKNFSALH